MRTVEQDPDVDCDDWHRLGIMSADWKASPDVVLDLIDELLGRHGLEVVMVDTHDDAFTFKVERRIAQCAPTA